MLDPTPRVSSRYGAPMGRYTGPNVLETEAGPLRLRPIPLVEGYDPGGAYWGLPSNLWFVEDLDGNSQFLRANSRATAEAAIRADWPDADFLP